MKVLLTGMSGVGKPTALRALGARGHRVVDTDTDRWSHWVGLPDGTSDWVWREEAMTDLLAGEGTLFVAGCKTNQGQFYPRFDHVVLLSAPVAVLLARIAARTDRKPSCCPEVGTLGRNDQGAGTRSQGPSRRDEEAGPEASVVLVFAFLNPTGDPLLVGYYGKRRQKGEHLRIAPGSRATRPLKPGTVRSVPTSSIFYP